MAKRFHTMLSGLGLCAAVALGYYAAARFSYALSFQPSGVVVIWIPAGYMLAVLIALEKRHWLPVLAGGFLGNVAADLGQGLSPVQSLAGPAVNSIEALLAAWLVVRLLGSRVLLATLKEVLGLILGAAVVSNGLTALLGAQVLLGGGQGDFIRAWFVWWIGDGIGMLVVAPAILTWVGLVRARSRAADFGPREAGLLLGLTALVAYFVLGSVSQPERLLNPDPYMAFPFLFWVALRLGPPGAAMATLIVALLTAWHASRGDGPFAAGQAATDGQIIQAYAYLCLASLSALIPAAVVSERRAMERHYRRLFENNPHPMLISEPNSFALLAVNDAAVYQYGFTRKEFLGMTVMDIHPPEELDKLSAYLQAGHAGYDEPGLWKHRKKDGTVFEVEIASHEIAWMGRRARLVLARDVTERRRLEAQLLQAQKMEAVGLLAGGIAHDFNNLLGVIIGYSELMLTSVPADDPKREDVEEIRRAGERAANLTRQLLAFSRKQVIAPRVFDLNGVIDDLDGLLRRTLGEDVALTTVLNATSASVNADPGQIEQVIMNLAINARDAMPSGGQLTIETANVVLEEPYSRGYFSVEAGRYVMLAVSDTGCGMDAETQRSIFEPFFTTKESGTGLGLSTVFGIVKQAGGYISVYSEPGHGTTFKVYLPWAESTGEEAQLAPHADSLRGDETILVVEDAEGIRDLVRDCLESKGYRVLVTENAAQAREVAQRHDGPIHLLLTDLVLPDLSGIDLAKRLAATRPRIRVLYMSGYADEAVLGHGIPRTADAFLQKPFTLDDLWRKVRRRLDAGEDEV